jgi:hypothetical protein
MPVLRGRPAADPRQRRGVDGGEHPVGIVQRDGRDAIVVSRQEFLQPAPRGRVLAGVQKGMAEVDRAVPQRLRDRRFAAQQIGFVLRQRDVLRSG